MPIYAGSNIDIRLQPVPIAGDISINNIGNGVLGREPSHQVSISSDYNGLSLFRYSLEAGDLSYDTVPTHINFSVFTSAMSKGKNKYKNSIFTFKNEALEIEYKIKLLIGSKKVIVERYENQVKVGRIAYDVSLEPFVTYRVSIILSSYYGDKLEIAADDYAVDSSDDILNLDLRQDFAAFPIGTLRDFSLYAGSRRSETKFWDQSLWIFAD